MWEGGGTMKFRYESPPIIGGINIVNRATPAHPVISEATSAAA